jgi:serine phosphatase RsbU (regulator of sigma subunit)
VVETGLGEQSTALSLDALRSLHEVGRTFTADLDLARVVQAVADTATRMCRAAYGAFFYRLTDAGGGSFTEYTLAGVPLATFDGFSLPRSTEIFGPTFNGERTVRYDDVTTAPGYGRNAPHQGTPAGHPVVRSYLAAPVVTPNGEVIGGLFLGHPEPGRFAHEDEVLVQEIAGYASIAVANAREHRAEKEIAQTLQQALLPPVGFHEGVEVAVRYRPAAKRARVGGDWYDVLTLDDGRLALTVGDVAGHSVTAAARMGTVRNALSVHVLREIDPGRSLLALDEHLTVTGQPGFVTVVQAIFDPADASMELARAGHLPPLVVPAEGEPYFVDGDPSPPIGVGLLRQAPTTVRVPLDLLDTIVFYTDGLVERRRTPTDVMMARLREFAGTVDRSSAERLCDEVLARFVEQGGGDDDVAMLAIRPLVHVPSVGAVGRGSR